jgi:HD superfamily phosphohydrolase
VSPPRRPAETASMSSTWPKVFRDPVHNLIAFEDTPCDRLLLDLVNAREVQRLRRIKQMGLTELVFPGANHSRFAHSLGVLHTARLFLEQFERVVGRPLPQEQRAFLLAAALLHDVGHGPFSHAFELVTGQWHEAFTRAILQDESTEVHQRLRAFDRDMPARLALFFDEDADDGQRSAVLPAYLTRVVAGQLDADRCDYLLRDSHATGTNYGDFDLQWMLAQLRPDPANGRFYLTHNGLSAAETYLFARFHMYRTVYFHKTSRAAEVMLKLLFRRLKELIVAHGAVGDVSGAFFEAFSGQICLTRYLDLDDHSVTELLKGCTRCTDAVARRLAEGLLHRRLYKAFDVTGLLPTLELSRIVAFNMRVTERLRELGMDPRYCFYEDSASDTPYEPYQPDAEKPSRQIYVESASGKIVEITELSEALGQLSRTYTVIRYYVPAEFRDELRAIARETLTGR